MDPRVGLPLGNTGMGTISLADAVKELMSCRAKRAKHIESERHEIEAVISTPLCVFVPLRLLNNRQHRYGIPQAPSSWTDAHQIDATVAIITPTI